MQPRGVIQDMPTVPCVDSLYEPSSLLLDQSGTR